MVNKKVVFAFAFSLILIVSLAGVYAFSFGDLVSGLFGGKDMKVSITGNPIYEDSSDGLVSVYHFNEIANGNVLSSGSVAVNGSVSGGAQIVNNGVDGKSLSLDGMDDYVSFSNSYQGFNMNEKEMTMSVWVYRTGEGYYDRIFTRYYNAGTFGGYALGITNLNKVWYFSSDGTASGWSYSKGDILSGAWHHILVTQTGTDATLYIDGVKDSSWTKQRISGVAPTVTQIGGLKSASLSFNGSIDEFMIYNKVLSQSEVSELYNNQRGRLISSSSGGGGGGGNACSNKWINITSLNNSNGKIKVNYRAVGVGDRINVSLIASGVQSGGETGCLIFSGSCGANSGSKVVSCSVQTNCDYPSYSSGYSYSVRARSVECPSVDDTEGIVFSTQCIDRDGGLNYSVKGNVTYSGGVVHDGCIIGGDHDGWLRELTCNGNSMQMNDYLCPNGCSDGACISDSAKGFNFTSDWDNSIQVEVPIKGGLARFNVLYGENGAFKGFGEASDVRLAVGAESLTLVDLANGDRQDEWFVASYGSGAVKESYLLFASVSERDGKNKTNILNFITQKYVCGDKIAGDTCNIGAVSFIVGNVYVSGGNRWVNFTAGPGVRFDRIYATNGDVLMNIRAGSVGNPFPASNYTFTIDKATGGQTKYFAYWNDDNDARVKCISGCGSFARACLGLVEGNAIVNDSYGDYSLVSNETGYINDVGEYSFANYAKEGDLFSDRMWLGFYVLDDEVISELIDKDVKEGVWSVGELDGNQYYDLFGGFERVIVWYNENVIVILGFESGERVNRPHSYLEPDQLLRALQDNEFVSLNYSVELPEIFDDIATDLLSLCGSQVEESCIPSWERRVEPAVCPEYGLQTVRFFDSQNCIYREPTFMFKCVPGVCSGCLLSRGETCIPYGTRLDAGESPIGADSYCKYDGYFYPQKGDDASCQNDYECSSGECRSGQCVNTYYEVVKQASLLVRVWCKVTNLPLFGGNDAGYEQCVVEYYSTSSGSSGGGGGGSSPPA